MPRKDDIKTLVTNCACQEAALAELDDETLEKLAENARKGSESVLVVNELRKGFVDGGVEDAADMSAEEVMGLVADRLTAALANNTNNAMDDDEDMDEMMDDDEEEATPPPKKKKKTNNENSEVSMPTNRRMTKEEFEKFAPEEYVDAVQSAIEVRNQEKARICKRLVANRTDEASRKARFKQLMGKSITELRELEQDLAPANNRKIVDNAGDDLDRYYDGSGGGDESTLTDNEEEVLDLDAAREEYDPVRTRNKKQ